jgi:hypothetical protein
MAASEAQYSHAANSTSEGVKGDDRGEQDGQGSNTHGLSISAWKVIG